MTNWYNMVKAMPLPNKAKYPENFIEVYPYALNRFKDEIDVCDEGEAEFLGMGCYGLAYDDPNDSSKVIKITRDVSEEIQAEKILKLQEEYGGFLPCVVGVHSVIKVSDQPAYKLVLEKVKPLSALEQGYLFPIFDIFTYNEKLNQDFISKDYVLQHSLDEVYEFVKQILIGNKKYVDRYDKVTYDYCKLVKNLMFLGFGHDDAHGANVGYRDNDTMVLLDLGDGGMA